MVVVVVVVVMAGGSGGGAHLFRPGGLMSLHDLLLFHGIIWKVKRYAMKVS